MRASSEKRDNFAEMVQDFAELYWPFENYFVDMKLYQETCDGLWNCTDQLPAGVVGDMRTILDAAGFRWGNSPTFTCTYASAARALKLVLLDHQNGFLKTLWNPDMSDHAKLLAMSSPSTH